MEQVLIHRILLKKLIQKLFKLTYFDKSKNLPSNLINLNSKVNKLNVDKLLPALVDLSKLRDLVLIDVVKKDVYNAQIKNI